MFNEMCKSTCVIWLVYCSMLGLDDSIVLVLALKDKLQMFREVDK